MKWGHQFKWGG